MRYVWRNGHWRDADGNPMELPDRGICAPAVFGDIKAYKSPLGDHWIDGRRAQREELKRNDMVINENPRMKNDREEYVERKARQAKYLEQRKAGLI